MTAFDDHPRKIAAGTGLAGAALAMAVTLVGGFEGKRNYTYFDIVGVPTYCYGGTGEAARIGARFSDEQCDQQLSSDLQRHYLGMVECAPNLARLSDPIRVSLLSLAYNMGVGNFCKSSIPRKLAAGRVVEACNTIRLYNRSGGNVVKGLTVRRNAEAALCLKGVS